MKLELLDSISFATLGVLISIFLLIGCAEDDIQSNGNTELRIKEYRYKGVGMNDFRNYELEYDGKGRLTKIIEGASDALFSYSDNDKLIEDRSYNYFYNDLGKLYKIKPKLGNDSIVITYNENGRAESKIWYIEAFRQHTEYEYDAQDRVIETYDYVEEDGAPVFSSYRNFYDYDTDDIIKSKVQIFSQQGDLTWESESLYEYENNPSPAVLIQNALGLDDIKTFIDVASFFPGLVIPLGDITGPYQKLLPNHNFASIESVEGSPITFSETFEYNYNADGYPTYAKREYSDSLNRTGITEYYWEYERIP